MKRTLLIILVLAAWPAAAHGAVIVASGQATAAGQTTVESACPDGTHSLSAGFFSRGDSLTAQIVSTPLTAAGSRAVFDAVGTGFEVDAYAMCGDDRVVRHSAKYVVAVGGRMTVATPCPSGTKAVGGGATTREAPGATAVLESRPVRAGRKWKVTVLGSQEDKVSFRAQAVCLKGEAAKGVFYRPVISEFGEYTSGQAVAQCPRGATLIGGGGGQTDLDTRIVWAGSKPESEQRWRTAFDDPEGPGSSDMRAVAVCRR